MRTLAENLAECAPKRAWLLYLETLKMKDARRNQVQFENFFTRLSISNPEAASLAYRDIADISRAYEDKGENSDVSRTSFSQMIFAAKVTAKYCAPEGSEGVKSLLSSVPENGRRLLAFYLTKELTPRDFEASAAAISVLEDSRKAQFYPQLLARWGKNPSELEAVGIASSDIKIAIENKIDAPGYPPLSWNLRKID